MATKIPNLWSQEDVKVEVLSPLVILRTQADNLEQMTKGLIETEITVTTSEKGETMYQLDAVAPALGGVPPSLACNLSSKRYGLSSSIHTIA